jgi:hypothetical protein
VDFAGLYRLIEKRQRFLHRRVHVGSMQLIEVDRLNAQAAEGRVQRTMEVAPRQSNRIDVLANIEAKVLRIIVSVIKNSSVRRSGSAQPVTKVAVALMGSVALFPPHGKIDGNNADCRTNSLTGARTE